MDHPQPSPRRRPLEVNEIDHALRHYGGSTIALEMEPTHMEHSKRREDTQQYLDSLSRQNGQLRLEITFYRECFKHAERFKDQVYGLSQNLLHECIIGLLDDAAFDEIRNISNSLHDASELFRKKQKKAFKAFVVPYRLKDTESRDTSV
jgi:hypothetical protein